MVETRAGRPSLRSEDWTIGEEEEEREAKTSEMAEPRRGSARGRSVRRSAAGAARGGRGKGRTFGLGEPDLEHRLDESARRLLVQHRPTDLERRLDRVEDEDERVLGCARKEGEELGQGGGGLCWLDVLLEVAEEAGGTRASGRRAEREGKRELERRAGTHLVRARTAETLTGTLAPADSRT